MNIEIFKQKKVQKFVFFKLNERVNLISLYNFIDELIISFSIKLKIIEKGDQKLK